MKKKEIGDSYSTWRILQTRHLVREGALHEEERNCQKKSCTARRIGRLTVGRNLKLSSQVPMWRGGHNTSAVAPRDGKGDEKGTRYISFLRPEGLIHSPHREGGDRSHFLDLVISWR
jgi:hypothetical protein